MNKTENTEIGEEGAATVLKGTLQLLADPAIVATNHWAANLNRVSCIMWLAGAPLVVMWWLNIVSNVFGWIGCSAVATSTVIGFIAGIYWRK